MMMKNHRLQLCLIIQVNQESRIRKLFNLSKMKFLVGTEIQVIVKIHNEGNHYKILNKISYNSYNLYIFL